MVNPASDRKHANYARDVTNAVERRIKADRAGSPTIRLRFSMRKPR